MELLNTLCKLGKKYQKNASKLLKLKLGHTISILYLNSAALYTKFTEKCRTLKKINQNIESITFNNNFV
jgi:hypothetical protein